MRSHISDTWNTYFPFPVAMISSPDITNSMFYSYLQLLNFSRIATKSDRAVVDGVLPLNARYSTLTRAGLAAVQVRETIRVPALAKLEKLGLIKAHSRNYTYLNQETGVRQVRSYDDVLEICDPRAWLGMEAAARPNGSSDLDSWFKQRPNDKEGIPYVRLPRTDYRFKSAATARTYIALVQNAQINQWALKNTTDEMRAYLTERGLEEQLIGVMKKPTINKALVALRSAKLISTQVRDEHGVKYYLMATGQVGKYAPASEWNKLGRATAQKIWRGEKENARAKKQLQNKTTTEVVVKQCPVPEYAMSGKSVCSSEVQDGKNYILVCHTKAVDKKTTASLRESHASAKAERSGLSSEGYDPGTTTTTATDASGSLTKTPEFLEMVSRLEADFSSWRPNAVKGGVLMSAGKVTYKDCHIMLMASLDHSNVSYKSTIEYMQSQFGLDSIELLSSAQCKAMKASIRHRLTRDPEEEGIFDPPQLFPRKIKKIKQIVDTSKIHPKIIPAIPKAQLPEAENIAGESTTEQLRPIVVGD